MSPGSKYWNLNVSFNMQTKLISVEQISQISKKKKKDTGHSLEGTFSISVQNTCKSKPMASEKWL